MQEWIKANDHERGCMLESIAQDLNYKGQFPHIRADIVDILTEIAAYMK